MGFVNTKPIAVTIEVNRRGQPVSCPPTYGLIGAPKSIPPPKYKIKMIMPIIMTVPITEPPEPNALCNASAMKRAMRIKMMAMINPIMMKNQTDGMEPPFSVT